jgi:PBSX family phage terminase large subunit
LPAREVVLDYRPFPHQARFHASPARYRALGGGIGGGKTLAACAEAILVSLEHRGTRGLIARQEHRTLDMVVLQGGSEILFRGLDEESKIRNLDLGWFFVDQAEEISEDMWLTLIGRLRHPAGPHRAWVVFNPAGHDWLWRRFVHRPGSGYAFFPVRTTDNPALPADYVESLLRDYPREWVERFVNGSFDTFAGQVYPGFDRARHVLPTGEVLAYLGLSDRDPPSERRQAVLGGMDFGLRNPTVLLWAGLDPEGRIFVFDEYVRSGEVVAEHVREILSRPVLPSLIFADPAGWNRDPVAGYSPAQMYTDAGFPLVRGNNDVLAGIARVAELIHQGRLYIADRCETLVRQMVEYRWQDPRRPERVNLPERPVKKDDHAPDALRYLVMGATAPDRPREAERETRIAAPRDWVTGRPIEVRVPVGVVDSFD